VASYKMVTHLICRLKHQSADSNISLQTQTSVCRLKHQSAVQDHTDPHPPVMIYNVMHPVTPPFKVSQRAGAIGQQTYIRAKIGKNMLTVSDQSHVP